jgi:hypothetical protein
VPRTLRLEPAFTSACVRADVGGQRDAFGVRLAGQLDCLGDRIAFPDDQVAALAAERLAQGVESLVPEPGPVSREALEFRIEHEQRLHPLGVGARAGERRVVVHAQVTGEQDNRGTHYATTRIGVPRLVSRLFTATAARRRLGTVARRVKTS